MVPYLLYQAADEEQFSTNLDRFYAFMAPYKNQRDVQLIGETLRRLRVNENDVKERFRLELLCRKVGAMYHEKFEQVPEIQKKLSELDL